jgi:hypothetical protein
MYFDAEMVLIYAIAIISGLVFYRIASRDPFQETAGEPLGNLCDSTHP